MNNAFRRSAVSVASVVSVLALAACSGNGDGDGVNNVADVPLDTENVCDFATTEQVAEVVGGTEAVPDPRTLPDEGVSGCQWQSGDSTVFLIFRYAPPHDIDHQWTVSSSSATTSVLEEPAIPGADEALVVGEGPMNVASVLVRAGDVMLNLTLPNPDPDRGELHTPEERSEAAQPMVSLAEQILAGSS